MIRMTQTLLKPLDRSLRALMELAPEVQVFLTGCGVSERAVFKVQLALEESIRNLIEHATGSLTNRIDLRIDVRPNQIVILLEDDSQPFDPQSAPPFNPTTPLEERAPQGMGLHLLHKLMDEIHYERVGCRNRLRLVVASSPSR